jgi:adenylate cyclase
MASKKVDLIYHSHAKGVFNKYPALTYVIKQVIYWIMAYVFLAIISYLLLMTAGQAKTNLLANLIIALYLGFFNGIVTGLADRFFERRLFYNKSLGIIILGKVGINLIVFIILISFVRYTIYPYLLERFFNDNNPVTLQRAWDYFFNFLLIYNIVAGLLISFINQVNRKFGPGVLLPLLLGRYRTPKEEERIFLFMDLKASTSIAEEMGHLKYSSFIRDSFMDINTMIFRFNAQIYQYVGDEIVLTWSAKKGRYSLSSMEFFFACQSRFQARTPYYLKRYGYVPKFKGGLHKGPVTAVEVGEIKRDIAYHGDTLNTASRIQSMCNELGKEFLSSNEFLKSSNATEYYSIESQGMVELKGKSKPIEIASISRKGKDNK